MVGKTDNGSAEEQQGPANEVDQSKPRQDGQDHRSLVEKLKHPVVGLRDKLKEANLSGLKASAINLKHRIGKTANIANPNHRHDEEHEKATDQKRTQIAEGHRFQSFAPERPGNRIKWYIDGRDYFHAVSVALERAKETIYIADWWLSPEVFLRRPPHFNQQWRLDYALKRAAERGVKVYVNLYKEVKQAVENNSEHSKHALEALCPEGTPGYKNIVVMRHPDHNFLENASDMTFYWAHHEKFIVIDYDLAFIGGLDLCFGRWDVRQHPLADAHPAGVQNEVFPGQDFNDNRIMDFKSVEDWKQNELSKAEYGRMPWHDVAMGLIGPCIYDIAEHFVLRWNFCKRDKYKRDDRYDWITMTGRTGENEDLVGVQRPKHPVGDYAHHPLSPLEQKTGNPNQGRLTKNDNSGNTAGNDDVFHDAPESLDEHGYTKHQHQFGHGAGKRLHGLSQHKPHSDTNETLPQTSQEAQQDTTSSAKPSTKQENPRMTGNDPEKEGVVSASGGMAEKHESHTSTLAGSMSTAGGQGSVHAQLVRSSADWSSGILTEQSIQNAYCEVIRGAQHYVYIENQFFITATGENQAPVHNQIGAAIVDACVRADSDGRKFRVIIMLPAVPGFAGDLRSDAATGTRAIMDYQYKSINRGEESIFGKIKASGVDPVKYIFCFNLRSYDRINKTPALTQQEDKSGVKYQELQREQAEEIMGPGVHGVPGGGDSQAPPTSKQGHTEPQTSAGDRRRVFEEQRDDSGLAEKGQDTAVVSETSVAKNAMLGQPKVSEEGYAGRSQGTQDGEDEKSRDQELENFIQEELYIHGKTLIVDDRIVICGSSNINDRSQLGFHDSELSIVMEDTLPLKSKMNGQEYQAGHHAATLRRMLWREHMGLLPPQKVDATDDINAQPPSDGDNEWFQGDEYDTLVEDPLSDEVWKLWTEQATTNTEVFRQLFHADPDNHIKTFEDYDRFLPKEGHKAGHLFDPYQPVDHVRRELDKIKGHLVWMPLDFLCEVEMAEKGLSVNQFTESVYT